MPIYEYELCDGECKICGGKFTLNRPLSAKPLTNCPACKKPVRKIFSNFSSPHKLKPLSVSDAKKSGFQVYKRLGKGEYEKQLRPIFPAGLSEFLGLKNCAAKFGPSGNPV